tara:strand:- start:1886 stop:2089 length:204 start_codon:yes stop_codon:yes gene_type:complete
MKTLKLTLHNDKPIVLNMDKMVHAMTIRDEDGEQPQEHTRILFEGETEIDVKEGLDDVNQKVWELKD